MLNKVKAGVGGIGIGAGALYARFQGYCGWFGRGAGVAGVDECADGRRRGRTEAEARTDERSKTQGYTLC